MTNSHTPAIEAEGLTKRFGDFTAVKELDLYVETGSVVSLLGPNGAGKTTMVRMLATLLRPDSGRARIAGHDVISEPDRVRRVISLTGQFAALDKHLTAAENLRLMARLRGHSAGAARKITGSLMERFDIEAIGDRLVKNLSGGERRRVDLAASLIDMPQLLVLDEPTTGLDPRSRQVVWSTVRDLVAEGVTLLLTTQYLEEADALADRVVLIDHGREIAAGTPAQLKAQVGEQRVDAVAADSAALEQLERALSGSFATSVVREQRTVSVRRTRSPISHVSHRRSATAGSPSMKWRCVVPHWTTRSSRSPADPRERSSMAPSQTAQRTTTTIRPARRRCSDERDSDLSARRYPRGPRAGRPALRDRHPAVDVAQPALDPARAGATPRRDDPADHLHPAVPLRVRVGDPRVWDQLQGLSVPGDHRPVARVRHHRGGCRHLE
jgi:daunorubicin resistance ABC transporter ATP-binding subunit